MTRWKNSLLRASLAFCLLGGGGPAAANYVVRLVPESSLNLTVGDTATVDLVLSGASDVLPSIAPNGDPIASLNVDVGDYNPGVGPSAVQIR